MEFAIGFLLGMLLGLVFGGWSAARAYEEGNSPDTGYEPTGSHWESRSSREEG